MNYHAFFQLMQQAGLSQWLDTLQPQVESALNPTRHGHLPEWLNILAALPQLNASSIDFNTDTIRVGETQDCDTKTREQLTALLKKLHPWRKGPYQVHDIFIDTEWRSDWKWQRVQPHLADLTDRVVLDVGCGSGYHCWRMLGAGAKLVVGIDPTLLSIVQFQAIQHFTGQHPVAVLPIGIEHVPPQLQKFDSVFSMGVLYHRRSPIDHLLELRGCLRQGGELILETLVVDGELGYSLVPKGRYANMRNVWFIPSCLTLESWLQRCGFGNVRLVDENITSIKEQRTTEWMTLNSLQDFLDPDNPALSIEGYPAPKRAIFIAERI
ncbi:tRNA 5-methoxyuridine(34)/uridine 5-oxyacetic acid(34) synthase CmoB [Candidatus Albibeggiatoa sp. nov. NOAA]|uniref:tRNA 5-methoxyuridine(34)/uridine 5-oxyacetic acid(34) synthase CmoB n=1 Tax=Candidatus Albibeggiatoa sp. nov. NOAA TaxID=3162724 RepID=UPI003304ED74|nr:tRNA 5-methoxyuridine(34)/uridine 5-oxyacetic acid(34) synthase CmoB [Thiotrichaceae bacterium]